MSSGELCFVGSFVFEYCDHDTYLYCQALRRGLAKNKIASERFTIHEGDNRRPGLAKVCAILQLQQPFTYANQYVFVWKLL